MDKKNKAVFKISYKIMVIIAVIFVSVGVVRSFSHSKIYNNTAENVLSEYRNHNSKFFCITSLLENNELNVLDVSVMLFSGNKNVGTITAMKETTIQIVTKQFLGEGKFLVENKANGEITTILFSESEISLEKGEYEIFLSGKMLCGNVNVTADFANAASIKLPQK